MDFDLTVDQRSIRLENFALAKLIRKMLVRRFSLRDDQQPRSSPVEAMNDARPGHARGGR